MKKTMMMTLLACTALLGGSALAKPPAPQAVRGTITAVKGAVFAITETSGAKITVTLIAPAKVIEVLPAALTDVKPGTFIGTAAIKQPNGVYRALELQIFPESMRGVGLGTRPYNKAPHSTMTNGTVGGMAQAGGAVSAVQGAGDLTLTVNDGSGDKTVLVPASVPVVTFAPGTAAELLPGAHVMIFPVKGDDGTLTTKFISVGKNGLVPPM
jgi:hypothetical protein